MDKILFNETEILDKLDLSFHGIPADDYPVGNKEDIKYNFFLDLEHGYFVAAGSKIHLYADKTRWAVVFEKCGYQNRGDNADIQLNYVGNCINYPVTHYPERNYITNTSYIELISSEEYERIRNKVGTEMEDFELISPTVSHLQIHGQQILIEHDPQRYIALGINPRDYDNPQNLIGYDGIIRYLSDTNPNLVSANEDEIKQHIPRDIPKLLVLDKFHVGNSYTEQIPPSCQETYKLIAKILVTCEIEYWKPTLEPNNHWTNWESGFL